MDNKIDKAKKRMVTDHPYFAVRLHRFTIRADETVTQTMATDGKSLFFCPEWVETLSVAETAGVLAHECMHVNNGHHLRRGTRDRKAWNIACDQAINGLLRKAGFVLPADGVFPEPGRENWSAERHFAANQKAAEKAAEDQPGNQPGNQPGDQPGNKQAESGADSDSQQSGGEGQSGNDDGKPSGPGGYPGGYPIDGSGDPDGEPGSGDTPSGSGGWGEVLDGVSDDGNALSEDEKIIEQIEIDSLNQQAAQVQRQHDKHHGRGSGGWLRNVLDAQRRDPQPWYEILAGALHDTVPGEECYSTPDRRLIHQGLILPDSQPEPNGVLVVAVDTSGSLSDEELGIYASHINDIVAEIDPIKTHVVYCDDSVQHTEEYERGEDVELRFHGGGGTSFTPVYNWVDAEEIDLHALIYFTDGEGWVGPNDPAGGRDFETPDYPVFWVTNLSDPYFYGCEQFGEIIHVD